MKTPESYISQNVKCWSKKAAVFEQNQSKREAMGAGAGKVPEVGLP
jgi:hypothetical protein